MCQPTFSFRSIVVFLPILGACGSSGLSQFPTSDELQRIAQTTPISLPSRGEVAEVATWDLTGPLPDKLADEPTRAKGVWSDLLDELVAGRPGLLFASAPAHCTARELGLFFQSKRAQPTSSLQKFITSRCALVGIEQLAHGFRYVEAAKEQNAAALFAGLAPKLKDDLKDALATLAGPQTIGLWFGQRNGLGVVSWVVGRRQARIEPMLMVPGSGGEILIEGEVLTQADHVEALINRGAYGFRRCDIDGGLRIPRFRARCIADPNDVQTKVEVAAFEPGRVLGHPVVSLLVWPKGEIGNRYREPALLEASAKSSSPGTAMEADLAATVNRVRELAGMKPLRVSKAESLTAKKLAPHYFAALMGVESAIIADQITLGLRAGWDIAEPLGSGEVSSRLLQGKFSAARMVSELLEEPDGRRTLLDPESEHLAVGVTGKPEAGLVGAIFSSYAPFSLGDPRERAQTVRRRLNDARAGRNLEPAETQPKVEAELEAVVRQVSDGGLDPDKALDKAVTSAVETTKRAVRGAYAYATRLDEITIPEDLKSQGSVAVALAVGQHRPKDEPWRRYIVIFLSIAGGSSN